jgi:hypothetical protein
MFIHPSIKYYYILHAAAACNKKMEDGSPTTGDGGLDKKGRAEHYKGRVTVHVIIACIVAATGGSLFGYDVGISGSVIIIPSLSNFMFFSFYKTNFNHLFVFVFFIT